MPLQPLAYHPLPLGNIRPRGWLLDQLRLQAEGDSGRLHEYWRDVAESGWIGGSAEGWERGPYWLDGFIPLAVLTEDRRLLDVAQRWVDYILSHQLDDGWLGPVWGQPTAEDPFAGRDLWPRFIVLKALAQWHEAAGDPRVIPAMLRFCRLLPRYLAAKPLRQWAKARWGDLLWSLQWLHDRTGEAFLLEIMGQLRVQGTDWPAMARDYPHRKRIVQADLDEFTRTSGGEPINDHFNLSHGVNLAMGFKTAALCYRLSQSPADRDASRQLIELIDALHGQATGIFTCDEHVAGKSPSQGTELCTVVETMFSLETIIAATGDVGLCDRLERLAFNALPAPFRPDMRAHQYNQQANQVLCRIADDRVWCNNGPDAGIFGQEPNFGCCTANQHQGWPKFVASLWMGTTDGGLVNLSWAPCFVHTRLGHVDVKLKVETQYPFREEVLLHVACDQPANWPLCLRIPAWTDGATVQVDGGPIQPAPAGETITLHRTWRGITQIRVHLPMPVRLERRYNNAVTVHRGPLVYALAVGERWHWIRGYAPHREHEVHATTAWNYAIVLDPADPSASLQVDERPIARQPFSKDGAPVRISAKGRRVTDWGLEHNAAAPPPPSPVPAAFLSPVEEITLLPYAAAKLRVTEIPVAAQD